MQDWKRWARAAGLRAIRTVAQSALASVGTVTMLGMVDWRVVFSTAVMAGILSLLTSVAGLPELDMGTRTQNASKTGK